MTTKDILIRAQRIIDQRKYSAEEKCNNTLATLRKDALFSENEKTMRKAEVAYALGGDETKQKQKQIVDACKEKQKQILAKHNLTEKDITPHYYCEKCLDEGYSHGKRCQCLEKEFRKLLFANSQIVNDGFTFSASTEEDKHNKAVYRESQKICRETENARNVLLTGKTGTGKTYLLCACANECVENGKSVLYMTAYTLNRYFLQIHTAYIEDKDRLMQELTDVDVLVIDDLGTEPMLKNVTSEYLFAVINERELLCKQTFISTNLTLAELKDRYDERIFSRILNQTRTLTSELVGNDKRI